MFVICTINTANVLPEKKNTANAKNVCYPSEYFPSGLNPVNKKPTHFFRTKRKRKKMALLLPSPLPRAPYGAAASTSSPLSSNPRLGRHPLAGAGCSVRRTPPPAAVREESWAGELAAAVPWKAAVSGALALTLSVSCCKFILSFSRMNLFNVHLGHAASRAYLQVLVWPTRRLGSTNRSCFPRSSPPSSMLPGFSLQAR
jgi:hypothetical protein